MSFLERNESVSPAVDSKWLGEEDKQRVVFNSYRLASVSNKTDRHFALVGIIPLTKEKINDTPFSKVIFQKSAPELMNVLNSKQ